MVKNTTEKIENEYFSCMGRIFCGDENLMALIADNGNHFTEYGIYENMILFFDKSREFEKGCLAGYTAPDGRNYLSAQKQQDPYIGMLILSIKVHGCEDYAEKKSICNS